MLKTPDYLEALVHKPIQRMDWKRQADEAELRDKRRRLAAEVEERRQQEREHHQAQMDKARELRAQYVAMDGCKHHSGLLMAVFCELFDTTKEEMTGRSRVGPIARKRHMLTYIIAHNGRLSTISIGKMFDNRDHTTVLNSIKRVERHVELYADTKLAEKRVLDLIRGNNGG